MRIEDLPVDVWVIIMKHAQNQMFLDTFNTLFLSGALNIPAKYKLDTFWIVVSQRHAQQIEERSNTGCWYVQNTFRKLSEIQQSITCRQNRKRQIR